MRYASDQRRPSDLCARRCPYDGDPCHIAHCLTINATITRRAPSPREEQPPCGYLQILALSRAPQRIWKAGLLRAWARWRERHAAADPFFLPM